MLIIMRQDQWRKYAPAPRRVGLQLRYWQRVAKAIREHRMTGGSVNSLTIARICNDIHLAMIVNANHALKCIENETTCDSLRPEEIS